MPNMDDFHAFKSTGGGSGGSGGGSGGSGCFPRVIFIGLVILLLYLLGKFL